MKRAIIVAAALAASGLLAYLAIVQYRERQVPPVVFQHVKNTSLRLSDCFSYELESSHITYKELFEKIDKNISEIDSKIIDVRTLQTRSNEARLTPLLEYMKLSQEALRGQEMLYHKQLDVSSAVESSQEAVRELQSASYYSREYALRSAMRADEQFTKAALEYEQANQSLRQTIDHLAKARRSASNVATADILFDPQLPTKLLTKLARDEAVAPGSPQRRTAADMRLIATAWEARATDTNTYATCDGITGDISYEQLAQALSPTYIKKLPQLDGWGNPFHFKVEPNGQVYVIRSFGSNGRFDNTPNGEIKDAAGDIVYSNGVFLSYPPGSQ
jgi:hypothetical protein